MKKALFLTAIASMALVSCVSEDVTNPAEQAKAKITFDSPLMYSNENSRANVYGEITKEGNYSYPKTEDFLIYAVGHTGDFTTWKTEEQTAFHGQTLIYDVMVDGWAPKNTGGGYYYWTQGKKMTYAACSPADLEQENWGIGVDNRTYGTTGLIITDFEVNEDAAKHYDLMFSAREFNKTSADMSHEASNYSGIPIKFQHALSSIRFSIANELAAPSDEEAHLKTDLVLKKVTLSGVKYKGTFNENIVEDGDTYEIGTNVTPKWIVAEDVIAEPYLAFEGSVTSYESPRYLSDLVTEDDDNTVHQLLVMPQDLTDESVLTIEYTVNGKENTKTVKLNEGLTATDKQKVTTWEMGKRYTYRLNYTRSSSEKDKIYFAPSTEDWKDVDVIVIEL